MPIKLNFPPPTRLSRAALSSLKVRGARNWLKRQAALVPLVENGKKPINKGGSGAPLTVWREVRKLFVERPDANYGIATGTVSNLFVVDIDGPEGRASLRLLERKHGPLPRTVTTKTPNGQHRYFRYPGKHVRNSAGRLGPGIDVRGDGGYVVGVGSVNESGTMYTYLRGLGPKSVPVADAPDWLIALVTVQDTASPMPTARSVPTATPDRGRAYAEAAFQSELERLRKAPEHQRNDTLNACAFKVGQLLAHGLDESAVTRDLAQAARLIGLDEAEIGPTIRSGLEAGQRNPRQLPSQDDPTETVASSASTPTGAIDELTRELAMLGETDADNAERFARRFGHKVIYTPGRNLLTYNGVRWCSDKQLQCIKLAEQTARLIESEAEYIAKGSEKAARARFAQQSLSKSALERMLDLAKARLVTEDAQLDANPWLFNVQNGTIDLRTGELGQHNAGDLITKVAPVTFDATAGCPTFKRMLTSALRNDAELIGYVQMAVGYSMTGDVREQVFFLLKGSGGTGKSTFVHVVRDMLGDYGVHTTSETLLEKKYDGIPSDVARLAGARMVTAVEANWSRQINEALVKALTGGDPITARFLFGEWFEFMPQLKIWFAVNDFPGVRSTSDAFWRRARVIPFTVQVAKGDIDGTLAQKLRAEWPGILNWAIQGCLAWQRDGLGLPAAVRAAGGQWQEAADHVRKFVNEHIIMDSGNVIPSAELYGRFRAWCAKNGEAAPADDRKLKAAFESLDLTCRKGRTATEWVGVKFRMD